MDSKCSVPDCPGDQFMCECSEPPVMLCPHQLGFHMMIFDGRTHTPVPFRKNRVDYVVKALDEMLNQTLINKRRAINYVSDWISSLEAELESVFKVFKDAQVRIEQLKSEILNFYSPSPQYSARIKEFIELPDKDFHEFVKSWSYPSFSMPRKGKTLQLNSNFNLKIRQRKSFDIFIRYPGRGTLVINYHTNDTLDDLMEKIHEKSGIPKVHQLLSSNGRPLSHIGDEKIQPGSTVHLSIRNKNTVDPTTKITVNSLTGKKIDLDMKLSDTINDVKTKIQAKEGILLDQQCLKFGSIEVKGSRTLVDYSIQDGSMLNLSIRR